MHHFKEKNTDITLCPACGSGDIARLVYGAPDYTKLLPEIKAKKVRLGGNCIQKDDSGCFLYKFQCNVCLQKF